MSRFERIVLRGHGLGFNLRIEDDLPRLLIGVEVDDQGESIEPAGENLRRHVIDKDQIVERIPLVFCPDFGILEPEGDHRP